MRGPDFEVAPLRLGVARERVLRVLPPYYHHTTVPLLWEGFGVLGGGELCSSRGVRSLLVLYAASTAACFARSLAVFRAPRIPFVAPLRLGNFVGSVGF